MSTGVEPGSGPRGIPMRGRLIVSVVATVLLVAACGDSESASSTRPGNDNSTETDGEVIPLDLPGVTGTEIRVAGVASITNPLGGRYDTAADGVEAYFAMVNDQGGLHGRELVLERVRDDRVSNNTAEIRGLIDQNSVFAVLPVATLLFTGADDLVEANIPTFGWTINPEWGGTEAEPRDNLFGQAGSYLCLGCPQPVAAHVAQLDGRSRIGLLAYNVPQSSKCLEGWEATFDTYGDAAGAQVVFSDSSLTYGTTNLSVQVQKMREARVDMVMTCMDTNAVVTLAQEMKKQGMDAIQYLPNAYDRELLEEFGDLFEGSFLALGFAPLETPETLRPEGLDLYERWIEETDGELSENSIVGWLNADLFVEGLRAAGPQFDRQKLIDAINAMDDYTAKGLLPGMNWGETGHYQRSSDNCNVILKVDDSAFVPVEPDALFTCFDLTTTDLEPFTK
jgi:branched-chain amino acid transport system substrate-binding protein